MTTVGIKQIGFIDPSKANDQWVEQQEQQTRSLQSIYLDGTTRFKSIDQQNAILSEKSSSSESGSLFELDLQFTVRRKEDIELAKKYINRPLVLHVWTVDGRNYSIGTKDYPAYLHKDDRYDGVNTRELALTSSYQSNTQLLN